MSRERRVVSLWYLFFFFLFECCTTVRVVDTREKKCDSRVVLYWSAWISIAILAGEVIVSCEIGYIVSMKGHLNCTRLYRQATLCKTASSNNDSTIKTVFISESLFFSLFYRNSSRFPSFPAYSSHCPFLPFQFPPTPNHASLSADFNKAIAIHAYEPLYSSGGSQKATMLTVFSFLLDIFRVLMLPFACLVQRTKEWVRARWRRSRKNIPSHSVIHGTAEEELTALCHRRKYIFFLFSYTLGGRLSCREERARGKVIFCVARRFLSLRSNILSMWRWW